MPTRDVDERPSHFGFAQVIRDAGGLPAVLSVWPTIGRQVDFDRATQSYQLAAGDVNDMHIPGGETSLAIRLVRRRVGDCREVV